MCGIILVATNLRPAITAVGPVIGEIRENLLLSNSQVGFLTTLPLIGFSLMSIFASNLGRKLGNNHMILFSLIFLSIGIVTRSFFSITGLFLGTIIIGFSIAICNVLLPGVIKQKYPTKIGVMTGVYSMSMGMFSTIAPGISVTFTDFLDTNWNIALLIWCLLSLIGLIVWVPQILNKNEKNKFRQENKKNNKLWKSLLAWKITLFMGLTSLAFYILITWFREILIDKCYSVTYAGWMLSLLQLSGIPASFLIPSIADKYKDQRLLVVIIGLFYIVGVAGLFGDSTSWDFLWVVCIGIGKGSSFSLALTLLSLKCSNHHQVRSLSGMAQSLGYALAATGPVLFGYLRDMTNSWNLPIFLLIFIILLLSIFGYESARNRHVS